MDQPPTPVDLVAVTDAVTPVQLETFRVNAAETCRLLNSFRHYIRLLRNSLVHRGTFELRLHDPEQGDLYRELLVEEDDHIRNYADRIVRGWSDLAPLLGCQIGGRLPGDGDVDIRIDL